MNRRVSFAYVAVATILLVVGTFAASSPQNAQGQSPDGLPEGPGKAELVKVCNDCHAVTKATALRLTRAGWTTVVEDMVKTGAKGTEKEVELIVNYLSTHFLGEAARPINLNTAPAIDLESVIGLLRSEARAVIAWREKTPCKDLDDLKKVPGLDFKKIDAARDRAVCF